MEKLLQWSIAKQTGDEEAVAKIGAPDPKMLQQLFGGPDEPALMTQAMAVVSNPEATDENKEVAFENFEMLIENLDNANNIENLKLWPSVIAQLLNSNLALQCMAASIIGIATQNNPKSQEAFLKHEAGLKTLVNLSEDSALPTGLKLKSIFAISNFIRNFKEGAEKFGELDGWKIVKFDGASSDHKLLLRKLSLVSAIISNGIDETTTTKLREENLVGNLVKVLKSDGHTGCIEKALNILAQLHNAHYTFSSVEISQLAQNLDSIEHLKDQLSHDDFNAARQVTSS